MIQTIEDYDIVKVARDFSLFICDAETNRSMHTIISYKVSMKLFLDFMQNVRHQTITKLCLESFGYENVKGYQHWLYNEKRCSAQTANLRVSQIRSFFKYMGKRDPSYYAMYLSLISIEEIKYVKNQHIVEPLTRDCVKTLVAEQNLHTTVGLKYATLISMMYNGALRINECVSLRIKDLHLKSGHSYAIVKGKGNRTRTVYLSKKMEKLLCSYIERFHGKNPIDEHYLFFSPEKGFCYPLCQRSVNKYLDKCSMIVHEKHPEMPAHIHSHQFRHAMATHLLEDGLNIAQISKMLGHKSIDTTMHYLGFTISMQEQAISKIESAAASSIKPKWKTKESTKTILQLFGIQGITSSS